ncbi:hypothetical protein CLOM_g18063, partial [Closterium sp. NIES-68]
LRSSKTFFLTIFRTSYRIPNASTRDRGGTGFEADLPSTISAQPDRADRHEKTNRVSPSQRTHPDHPLRRTVPQYSSHRNRTEACACAIDYRALNKQTIKNKYPITRRIGTDRTSIWSCRSDSPTRRATFQAEMNHILRPLLDECVVVYLDDILIYSRDMKQHVEHLRRVFEILRRERFYVKLSKSKFALEKVQFLGHMVSAQGVHVDPKKVEAVRTWKTPENVKELQQFLGFANYYNRFVPQYAKLAAPLTNLLKKNTPYNGRRSTRKPRQQQDAHRYRQTLLLAHMADDVQKFVTSCDTCQRMKSSKQKKAGLLQPLPVPEQPWQVVSLDFIIGLPPTSSGHDAILVVIDKFSKMGHFIPTHTTARTEETAQLFVRHIISQHGIPTTLISDRDPKFTSKFWKELMSLLGTKLAMSSAYHPQTDGQTERLNQIVETL